MSMIFEMLLDRIYDTLCCRRKKHGWFFTIGEYRKTKLSGKLSFLFKRLFLFGYSRLQMRYDRNKHISSKIEGYIYGQGEKLTADMLLGKSRTADVGCECIAVYNAMQRINQYTPFCDVLLEMEMNHMTWFDLGGCLGLDPRKLYRYFDAHRVTYKKYTDMEAFQSKAGSRTCIAGFKLKDSRFRVHTVMLHRLRDEWIVYNSSGDSQRPMKFSSLNDVIGGGRFMVGYVLYKKKKSDEQTADTEQ